MNAVVMPLLLPASTASISDPKAPRVDTAPVSHRPYWEHHNAELTPHKRRRQPQFRDFTSKPDAVQRQQLPNSIFRIEPPYLAKESLSACRRCGRPRNQRPDRA